MKLRSLIFLSLSAMMFATACSTPATTRKVTDPCLKTRAAIDVGSGSTKLKVARVDTCQQKVLEFLGPTGADESRSVSYKEDLARGKTGRLSEEIMAEGLRAIQELREVAVRMGADEFAGAATSAFRTAGNGEELAARITRESGVKLKVISQEDEARLGFIGAAAHATGPQSQVVVWDIGGGSMQISAYDPERKFLVYEGQVASVPFKDLVIRKVKVKDPSRVKSPNPLSREELKQAEWLAARVAREEKIPSELRARLKNPESEVLGIGGVHYYSVRSQTGTEDQPYTPADVARAAATRAGQTDEEIGGKYASTEVTNIILVQGFMNSLGISRVRPLNVTMSDGVLLDPTFWEK